jgi:hypothetical protein
MKTIFKARVGMVFPLLAVLFAFSAPAAPPPDVAGQIPADAVYVVFISNPGEALANLDSILGRFKSLSPEMDLAKQGQQIQREIGENLLTSQGLEAMGIDPAGTSAIYGPDLVKGPMVAVALRDAALFKQKLTGLIQKKDPRFNPQPKTKAGVEIYDIEGGYIGFSGSWCVLLPPESVRQNSKDRQLLAFFKKGRKLATTKAFKRSVAEMPAEAHAWVYFDIVRVLGGWLKARQGNLAEVSKAIASMPAKRRKKIKKELKASLARERKDFLQWKRALGFVESYAASLSFLPSAVRFKDALMVKPAGARVLKKFFPAQAGAPAFHQDLVEPAVMGGWLSVDLLALLDHFASVPFGYQTNLKQALRQEGRWFKQETKLDLIKDLMAICKGPAACYLLTPADAKPDPKVSLDSQLASLVRFACVAKTPKPKKTRAVITQFNKFVSMLKKNLETKDIGGVSVSIFKPEPGVTLSWGLKGDAAFIAFGEGTADALARVLPADAWKPGAPTGEVGSASMDFAVLTESISSAVARGVGDAQFRMAAWPMAQQVLSKLGKLSFSARLLPSGLTTTGSLELR